MKIVHVITALGIGGAEKLLLNVVNNQVKEHQVYVIYLKDINELVSELDQKVEVHHFGLSLQTPANLRRFYKKISPDIIHTHLAHADILGIWASRNLKSQVFCTMHNIYFRKNHIDPMLFGIYRLLFNQVSKNTKVISISKSVENHVLHRLKVSKHNSYLLYNAISNYTQKELRLVGEKPSKRVEIIKILFIGRLSKQKSIQTLFKALKIIKDSGKANSLMVYIVGDGELRKSLENLAQSLAIIEMVRFEGLVQETAPYFYQADMFVLPSIWEGFGMVILEAFRAKIPVISSDIEGPSELIQHMKNGLLFKPKDSVDLAKQISLLIEDKKLREQIALEGYRTFTTKYQIDNYVESLNQIYSNALGISK